MANPLSELFGKIANSIRGGLGEIGKMSPNSFPTKIDEIVGLMGESSEEVNAMLDEINGEIIAGKVVTFIGADGSVLCEVTVAPGFDCPNPIGKGIISTPKKESTVSEVYAFSGWGLTADGDVDSNALKAVNEDRTVYAVFASSVRCYDIKFYDGGTLLQTLNAAYGSKPLPDMPTSGEYAFARWEPELVEVTGETSYYAVWSEKLVFANAAWDKIAEVCESGLASQHFAIGDTRNITISPSGESTRIVAVEIVGFNYDTLADGSGKAGISVVSVPALTPERYMNESEKTYNGVTCGNAGGWGISDVRTYCGSLFDSLQSELKAVIKPVTKDSNYGYAKPGYTAQTIDSVWIPSRAEVYDYGTHYERFDGEKDRIKYLEETQTASYWWLRDANTTSENYWYVTGPQGGVHPLHFATYPGYGDHMGDSVVFGFCI